MADEIESPDSPAPTGDAQASALPPSPRPRRVRGIALRHPRAPFLRRWAAGILDLLLAGLAILVVNRLIPEANHTSHPWLGGIVAVEVAIGYYWLPEALWGRTLGKLAAKIRVVDEQGRPPGAWRALVRTLLRFLEVNPFLVGGAPAAAIAYFSKSGQRLGDLLARTYVLLASDLERFHQGLDSGLADVSELEAFE